MYYEINVSQVKGNLYYGDRLSGFNRFSCQCLRSDISNTLRFRHGLKAKLDLDS
jgi:hypothetical protein